MIFDQIRQQIIDHPDNAWATKLGYSPLYTASATAKIVIIGQTPGIKAQESEKPWDDKSGDKLMQWLGIDGNTLRNPAKISLLPMDFYYPGKGKAGDLPPRKDFAPKWHPAILKEMPQAKLTILIGQYSQKHYLGKSMERNLTETVRNYHQYLPDYFPIVHPSPLNFRWQAKNPWFEKDTVPSLKEIVRSIIQS